MHPHTSYFICATPRTGSFLLCEVLRNTQHAGQPNEYFGLGQERFFQEKWGISNYADYIAKVIAVSTTPNGVFGTKMLSLYFDSFVNKVRQFPGFAEMSTPNLLSTIFPNLQYIWLTRRDKLRQAISYWKAMQTQIWASPGEEPPLQMKEPIFDFEAIDALVQKLVKAETVWRQYFDANSIEPFTVVYEELAAEYEATALGILHFLNIPVPRYLVFENRQLRRQADALSEQWVQQYYQLKNLL